jgi:hypothetical protein
MLVAAQMAFLVALVGVVLWLAYLGVVSDADH